MAVRRTSRWALVAVSAVATVGLLLAPSGASVDRTGPFALVACGALAVVVLLEARRPLLRAGPVAAIACGLLLLAVVFPPRTSNDLWSYAMYGRVVATHHADPYLVPPSAFPSDPMLQRVSPAWRSTATVYGPAFTGLSAVLARPLGTHPLPTRLAYQAMAALAVGAVLVALARRGRTVAVLVIGLQPLVVVDLVNGGHNDALVGLALLVAAWAAARRRPVLVAVAATVAVTVKLVALLPAVMLVAWLWYRHGRHAAAVAGSTLAGLVAVAYLAVGGPRALAPLAHAAGFQSRASIWRLLELRGEQGAGRMGLLLLLVVVPATLVAAARLHAKPASVAAAAVLPYLLAAPYVLPWYFGWALPLAAFADDAALVAVLFVATLLVDLAYTYRVVPHPDELDLTLREAGVLTSQFALVALLALVAGAAVVLWHGRGELRLGRR